MKSSNFLVKISLFLLFSIPFISKAQWTETNISEGRVEMTSIAIGDNIYFIGGSKGGNTKLSIIDVYNAPSGTWTTLEIPGTTARFLSFAIGEKLYIRDWDFQAKLLHVYDTTTDTWSELPTPTNMSQFIPMDNMILARTSSSLYFYNFDTEEWTEKDFGYWPGLTMALAKQKVFLAGGNGTDDVKIYDIVEDSWSEAKLSLAREEMRAIGYDNRVYFVAGEADGFDWTDRIDIYNIDTDTWTIDSLSLGRQRFDMTIHDDKLYIAGGQIISFGDQFRAELDVLDLQTNTWEHLQMPTGRRYATVVGHENNIYIAGGDSDQEDNMDIVEVYSLNPVSTDSPSLWDLRIFPNPVSEKLFIQSEKLIGQVDIHNLLGQKILSTNSSNPSIELNVSMIKAGLYMIHIENKGTRRLIIK